MSRATVITDASFCPNTRAAGWAAWVTYNYTDEQGVPRTLRNKKYGAFHTRPANSTEAERWAAWNGIWLAYRMGARRILCQTDCLTVVQGRTSHSVAPKYWPDAVVNFRHVKGHTRHDEPRYFVNRWCDTHAGKIMRQQRESFR